MKAGIYARFFIRNVENADATKAAGHVVFDQETWVELTIPSGGGGMPSVTPMRSTPTLEREYPEAFKAFKNDEATPVNGTPLKEWPLIQVHQIEVLERLGIRSIEDLHAVGENIVQGAAPGMGELKRKAKSWIEAANTTGKKATALADKDQKIADLEAENIALRADNASLTSQLKHAQK